MRIKSVGDVLQHLARNIKNMLVLAWKMDAGLTALYYGTAAISALVPMAAGLTMKYLIDNLQLSQKLGMMTVPLILMTVLATRYVIIFLGNAFHDVIFEAYANYLFRYKLQNHLTYLFYSKLAGLDISYLEDSESQDLIAKAKDTVAWRVPDFFRGFSYLFGSIIGFVSALVVLWVIAWWIPVLVVLTVIPRFYLKLKYGKMEWSFYGSGIPEARKIWYFESLFSEKSSISEIRIFRAKDALLEKFRNLQDSVLKLYRKPVETYVWINFIPLILEILVLFFIASFKLPEVLAGVITIGSFSLIVAMIDQLNREAGGLAGNFGWAYGENLYVDYFLDVMRLPKRISEPDCPIKFDSIVSPTIEFKNVSFGYVKDHLVLKDVSFKINPGESIALVGENGAGKTTIIKLLCRFYDVSEGEILINNVNIKNLSLDNWYQFIGTLFQDFEKYNFSVKDNIILGDSLREDADLMKEVAERAGIASIIETFPNKYDQFLGRQFEEGEELSIGQWQKLAIARAFYRQSPVLIMDEPTSAIDPEAELKIFNQLEKSYKNKTLILVSHRFSTVKNANKIFVIENGKISETGTHTELMKLDGKYAKMFTVQAKSYES